MKKKSIAFVGLAVAAVAGAYLAFGGFAGQGTKPAASADVKRIVADYAAGVLKAQSASATSERLVVTGSDGKETAYDLPKDEFFVSVAPYANATHPCAIHNLVSCRGEMANASFDVRIVNEAGDVVLDESLRAGPNGFVDLWLPRNGTFAITVERDGKSATSAITTYPGDDTCVTTLRLTENKSV